jgi:hypothetical protein
MMAMRIFKYKNEYRQGGTGILYQLLLFIQPRFHEEVKRRYLEFERCIDEMLDEIDDLKSEEITRQESNKRRCFCYPIRKKENSRNMWEKRIFLTGSTASYLLGMCDSFAYLEWFVCYNGNIYNVTTKCSKYLCEGIDGVCLCGKGCGFFNKEYIHPERFCIHNRIRV